MKTKKRLLGILLSLALVLGLMPGMTLTAYAATLNDTSYTWSEDSTITDDVTIDGIVTVSNDLTLTIPAGKTLTVNGQLNIGSGKTLTVTGTGTLTVKGATGNTAIEGIIGTLVVNGATVNAIGGNGIGDRTAPDGIMALLIVNSGTVIATGGKGGDVDDGPMGPDGGNGIVYKPTINGGTVIATGGEGGQAKFWEMTYTGDPGKGFYDVASGMTLGTGVTLYGSDSAMPAGVGDTDKLLEGPCDYEGGSSPVTYYRYMKATGSAPVTTYDVTYKVVNGTWSDDSTTDKTETVKDGSNPASVPTGMKASEGYTGGAWDTDPTNATITEATTFTYTFTAKQASTVTKAPEAKNLTYNGSAQDLVTAGEATGGTMQYALGTATEATEPYTTSIPKKTNAGTYYVWYKAVGDETHDDSEAEPVTVTVLKADAVPATVTGNTVKINEAAKPLVTVTGEATGGTMQYALGSSTEAQDEFAANIPTTDDIGAVGIYYVWYKVVGDENHNDSKEACVTATVSEEDAETFTVRFDAGGGWPVPRDQAVEAGGKAVRPATDPKKTDNEFLGWYEEDGTTPFDFDAPITANTTVYAVWKVLETGKQQSGGGGRPWYYVRVSDAAHGKVESSRNKGEAGQKITLTVTPDEGCELDKLEVVDGYGEPVEVTKNDDGTWSFLMPDHLAYVTASFKESAKQPELPFGDVTPDMPCYEDVKYVYEKGILIGVGTDEFGPALTLSRGMLVTALYRMEGEPEAEFKGAFGDVPAGKWFSGAVEWAAEAGIVLGYGDGSFGPGEDLTREQLAVILYRYAIYKGLAVESAALTAPDAKETAPWAAEAMAWAVANGILTADEDGSVRPTDKATRAEIAAAIRAFDALAAK